VDNFLTKWVVPALETEELKEAVKGSKKVELNV
jgi:hypothetical protein